MSYETVLEQVKSAPEACLDEISKIIGYVVYRYQQNEDAKERTPSPQLEQAMMEALQISNDPTVKGYTSTKELFQDLNS